MPSTEQQITTVLDQEGLAATGRGLVQLMLVSLGLMVAFLGLRMAFADGWTGGSFHGPAVPLLPVVAGGMAIGYLGRALWTRGRLRAALVAAAAAIVVLVGGITLVANLPEDIFPGPPNWVPVLAGAVVATGGLLLGTGPARMLDDDGAGDPLHWSTRTQQLLRGRYGFKRSWAGTAVEGFRRERAATGAPGAAGDLAAHPEVAAAELAAREPDAALRSIRINRLAWLIAAVVWLALVGISLLTGEGAVAERMLPLVLGFVVLAWSLRRYLPARRASDASALMDRRRARARRIALVLETAPRP